MRKIIAFLTAVSLLLSFPVLKCAAKYPYPESRHSYEDNTSDVKTYVHPETVEGLFVTFSENTYTEPASLSRLSGSKGGLFTDSIFPVGIRKTGDTVRIEYGDGLLYGEFQGDELAGQTLYLPSDSFRVILTSDSTVNGYGYSIDSISTDPPADIAKIIYTVDSVRYVTTYKEGGQFYLPYSFKNKLYEDKAVVGWQTGEGDKYYYDNMGINKAPSPDMSDPSKSDDELLREYRRWLYGCDFLPEGGKTYEMSPIFCPVSITSGEVYSFTNSSRIFCKNTDGYFYTQEHYFHQFLDYGATFALSPLAPAAAVACAVITLYWPGSEWNGSCCGFPITVLLQHYGKIDMLSEQGVSSVSELEPTDNVISRINFYNNQAVSSFSTDNMGISPGTKEYTRQLMKLYDTLEKGTPVYFEYYMDGKHPLMIIRDLDIDAISGAHGVLLTGAYTDQNGAHILLGYNNNSSNYMNGYTDVYSIDKDFTCIYDDYGRELNGFSWNHDVKQFESFPCEGLPNPFSWYISFFRNLFENIAEIIRYYFQPKAYVTAD